MVKHAQPSLIHSPKFCVLYFVYSVLCSILIPSYFLFFSGSVHVIVICTKIFIPCKTQILKTGFFHADPHPGNLAIDKDGSLIYYDFGMMGEIKSFTRDRLLSLFYAVYEKDANKVSSYLHMSGAHIIVFCICLASYLAWC